jgi:cell division protease FtsH
VAEEIVFGRISTGAQNDLERITKMSYAMVVDYGMSERIGYVSFNLSGRGQDNPMFDKPYSEDTARMIDEEVKVLISEIRERARTILTEKREQLETMAQMLLKKEILLPKDLVEILGPRPYGDYIIHGDIEALDRPAEDKAPEARSAENGTGVAPAATAGGDGETHDQPDPEPGHESGRSA